MRFQGKFIKTIINLFLVYHLHIVFFPKFTGGFIPWLDCREVYIHWLDCHEVSSPDWIVGTFHPLIELSGFLIPINLCYWCRINSFDIYFNHLVVESSYCKVMICLPVSKACTYNFLLIIWTFFLWSLSDIVSINKMTDTENYRTVWWCHK
jgi:hypothetical protein